jgi:hypothetical protein
MRVWAHTFLMFAAAAQSATAAAEPKRTSMARDTWSEVCRFPGRSVWK